MRLEKITVQSMPGLLEKLFCTWSSKKTRTEVFFYLADQAPRKIWVLECFDDGKGHSGALSERETIVAEEVFQEALRSGFICQMSGHGSRVRFLLTRHGEDEYWRLKKISEKRADADKPKAV